MENTQQTPKEEAQVPEAVPPLAVHSEDVKHVPLYPFEAPQAEFGNVTTLKTDKILPPLACSCSSSNKVLFSDNTVMAR